MPCGSRLRCSNLHSGRGNHGAGHTGQLVGRTRGDGQHGVVLRDRCAGEALDGREYFLDLQPHAHIHMSVRETQNRNRAGIRLIITFSSTTRKQIERPQHNCTTHLLYATITNEQTKPLRSTKNRLQASLSSLAIKASTAVLNRGLSGTQLSSPTSLGQNKGVPFPCKLWRNNNATQRPLSVPGCTNVLQVTPAVS